ncbi:MAG TPA: hypothetical protein VEZ70_03400 [Allosphingosinicella sp.]|nr:hypothetical protein [Allosphingosinicella sp.]
MGDMRATFLFLPLLLVACGESVRDDHFGNMANTQAPAVPREAVAPVRHDMPVRVGELGVNFDACASAGTTRHLKGGDTLPVKAAPFENSAQTGTIANGERFFVCTRSHDQKWLGVVYDEGGALAERCGVSSPVRERRGYEGPCRSGWVASAFVKLVAGVDQPPPTDQPEAQAGKGG